MSIAPDEGAGRKAVVRAARVAAASAAPSLQERCKEHESRRIFVPFSPRRPQKPPEHYCSDQKGMHISSTAVKAHDKTRSIDRMGIRDQ